MRFCPECGSELKEKINVCELCGYGKNEKEIIKSNNQDINNKCKIINQNINSDVIQFLKVIPLEELKKRKLDYGIINSISYTNFSEMEGTSYSEIVNFKNKELIVDDKTFHNSSNVRKVYKVSNKDIEKIKKIIIENNMFAWSEVPVNKPFLKFYTPSNNMNIDTEKYKFTISYDIFMDLEENKIFNDLRSLVHSFIKDENLISNEVINDNNKN